MNTTKAVSALVKAGQSDAVATLQSRLRNNVYAAASRSSPNGPKLVDGAIQRNAVQPNFNNLSYLANPDKIGLTKRPQLGVFSSGSAAMSSNF